MKQFVDIFPKCEDGGELCITKIQVDLKNCCYILHCECILCGREVVLIFGLEDFITINNIIAPQKEN